MRCLFVSGWPVSFVPALLLCGHAVAKPDESLSPSAAGAAQNYTQAWPTKPSWLSEISVGVKESYDENVFLSGVDAGFLPTSYTVPPGSVAALKNQGSWVTSVSPKIGVNLAPIFENEMLKNLAFSYSPEVSVYHELPSEDNQAHRVATSANARSDSFSLTMQNAFSYIHGPEEGPVYPGSLLSALGIGAPRERREQVQDQGCLALEYDQGKWFARPVGSLLYYDLMTALLNTPGYMNYVDRYDANGGADIGYKLSPRLGLSLGYRYGHQYQQQLPFSPYTATGDYQRALVGAFGAPWRWLEFNVQGGPDFREYPADTATRVTPVDDKHPVTHYGEASVSLKPSTSDSLTFKYKEFLWVSSIGKVPYFDSSFCLSYQRKLTSHLTVELMGKECSADYSPGNLSTCNRNDRQYTVSVRLAYATGSHASFSLAYAHDFGRNAEDGLVDPSTREYDRNLISLGGTFIF